MQNSDAVRAVAEVLASTDGLDGGRVGYSSRNRLYEASPPVRALLMNKAECLLDWLEEAGYRVVPK